MTRPSNALIVNRAPVSLVLKGVLLSAFILLSACGERRDVARAGAAYAEEAATQTAALDPPPLGPLAYGGGYAGRYGSHDEAERDAFDEYAARRAAEDEISADSYAGVGMPYGCTDDCSGHEAGFRYRADTGSTGYNPDSNSFNEGGQAFEDAVDDRIDEMRNDYDSGGDAPY